MNKLEIGLGVQKESQTYKQMARLDKEISSLGVTISQLCERLNPVLGPSSPNKNETGPIPTPILSPLANEISACSDKVHAHIEGLQQLMDRLEV